MLTTISLQNFVIELTMFDFLYIITLSLIVLVGGALDQLVVETTEGLVRGQRIKGLDVWASIPYAEPPVGSLRYQEITLL